VPAVHTEALAGRSETWRWKSVTHLLRMYLPDRSQIAYTLRNRNNNKILIPKTSDLNERHFLIGVLYKHCY